MTTQNNNEFLDGKESLVDKVFNRFFDNIWRYPSELEPNRIFRNREKRRFLEIENKRKTEVDFGDIWDDFMFRELRDWAAIIRRQTKTKYIGDSGKRIIRRFLQ
jgi:hypothetical protein